MNEENFVLRHTEAGVVSMASTGTDRVGSQFFITTSPQPQLDGRNVAFGKVIQGYDVVSKIENVFTVKGRPVPKVTIVDCGIVA